MDLDGKLDFGSKNWIKLINKLEKLGFFCLLMGGPDEDEMNRHYQSETNATYLGIFSLEEFIAVALILIS